MHADFARQDLSTDQIAHVTKVLYITVTKRISGLRHACAAASDRIPENPARRDRALGRTVARNRHRYLGHIGIRSDFRSRRPH
jgi:hypothetical protein